MSEYKYKCPTEKGLTRIYIDKNKLQSLLPNRKFRKCLVRPEVYVNVPMVVDGVDNKTPSYQIDWIPSLLLKTLAVLVFLPSLFYYGISNWKEVVGDTREVLYPKKYGGFRKDSGWNKEFARKLWETRSK